MSPIRLPTWTWHRGLAQCSTVRVDPSCRQWRMRSSPGCRHCGRFCAFDKVSHLEILHKMREMGVTGLALTWLHGYLSTPHLQLTVGGRCSSLFPVRASVPQGSILGRTLFQMYVHDAHKCLASGTDGSSFIRLTLTDFS